MPKEQKPKFVTPWDEEKAQFVRDHYLKMSASQIAAALGPGFTRNSIVSKAARMKLSKGNRPINAINGRKSRRKSDIKVNKARFEKKRKYSRFAVGPSPLFFQSYDEKPSLLKNPKSLKVSRAKALYPRFYLTGGCRWIEHTTDTCDATRVEGTPYCSDHLSRVVQG